MPAESLINRTQHQFVSGASLVTDDLPVPANTLHIALGLSTCASGRLLALDTSAALAVPGVVSVLTAADIPGTNRTGTLGHDPVFVHDRIEYHGQVMFAVIAQSAAVAEAALDLVHVSIEVETSVVTISASRAAL